MSKESNRFAIIEETLQLITEQIGVDFELDEFENDEIEETKMSKEFHYKINQIYVASPLLCHLVLRGALDWELKEEEVFTSEQ